LLKLYILDVFMPNQRCQGGEGSLCKDAAFLTLGVGL